MPVTAAADGMPYTAEHPYPDPGQKLPENNKEKFNNALNFSCLPASCSTFIIRLTALQVN